MMNMQLELVEFVKEPSWREILLESIDSQQMNPWEVDLVKIADAYLQKVKEMQSMDLRVPANVILASALLLRYKAQALSLEEPVVLDEEPLMRSLIDEPIPDLILNPNNPRSRTLTLQELISAVEEVMGIERRELRPRILAPPLQIELPKENIGEMMRIVHSRAHELKDNQNILLFSELVSSFNGHGEDPTQLYVRNLLPVLHLIQEERMYAWQDRLFGEIFLKVLN